MSAMICAEDRALIDAALAAGMATIIPPLALHLRYHRLFSSELK